MTVAEALEPLYRSYLRRLDEMAARLPAEAVLTERTTRGDDGRLALSEGGLPLRFDVADARDGHTWEVHGAHPDAPLAAELSMGMLQLRLEPGNWEELAVVCAFDGAPLPEDAEALADLLRGFAVLAWYGGFGVARPPWSGRLHGVRVGLRENLLWGVFDLGTVVPGALESLCAALAGYAEQRVPLAHVRIGGAPP